MALLKTVTTETGFVATDAYHRVEEIHISPKDRMSFRVKAFKDASLPPFAEVSAQCPYDLNGANPFVQAYLFLKKNGFSEARDA